MLIENHLENNFWIMYIMDYQVANPIEQAVTNQVNALVGNNDVNLNTIVKMSLMDEILPVDEATKFDILERMRANNAMERFFVEKEYSLTYDLSGNIVPINNIDDEPEKVEENI